MMAGFKKYTVDHEALFNDVRSNRYAKDKAPEPAKAEGQPVEDGPKPDERPPMTPAVEAQNQDTAPPVEKTDTPAPSSAEPASASAKPAAKGAAKETETVQVRVRVRFPASGVSPKYDALAAQLGEDDAFRAVFRAAFENYRNRLDEGKMPEGPKSYPMGKETHRSTKVMTVRQFKVVTDALDPDGLTAPATLGRIIAERALALFFDKEAKTA
ncbi:VirC2 family conjugal transfer protein [Falsirhodobacter sp. 1013]|uniref:VirC2 family conjugal transfer protein n=1 Tax=Falsirhodobacter sp. 1013 TaxID=3417566 RepID=UPI003EBE1031